MYHPSWFDKAACKNKTNLFFPFYNERPKARIKREAKALAICAQCPVVMECRAYARHNSEYGIWGAETEEQRIKIGYIPYGNARRRPKTKIINSKLL